MREQTNERICKKHWLYHTSCFYTVITFFFPMRYAFVVGVDVVVVVFCLFVCFLCCCFFLYISQLSTCGHFAITDTPIIRTAAKSRPGKNKLQTFD